MPRLAGALLAALLLTACSQGATRTTGSPTSAASVPTTGSPPIVATTLPSRPPFCDEQWTPAETGTVRDPDLREISGAAVSRTHPDVLWVHNDSGDDAAVAALTLDGTLLGRVTFPDLTARDWEDMAVGPGPDGTDHLYLADIGDNNTSHPSVFVHRIPEPSPDPGSIAGGETLEIVYPDGPVEAESLLVDPVTADIVILGKALSGRTSVFEIPGTVTWGSTVTADFVGTIPLGTFALATGGDAGTTLVVVRTYDEVFLWTRRPGDSISATLMSGGCRIARVSDQQGEAVALQPNGEAFYALSEGVSQPVLRYSRTGKDS